LEFGVVPVATTDLPQQGTSIADLVEKLREAIIVGALTPNERLIEVDLAASLKTNRANVRTVLALLEKEGLVTREPNRGARVRLISDQEALEIAETRQALEALVTHHAATRATAEDRVKLQSILSEMEASFAAGDLKGFSGQNGRLHEEIRRIAANATATKLLQGLRFHFVRVQYQSLLMPGRVERSMQEHRAIVSAICAGDAAAAEAAMRLHLDSIMEGIRWYIDSAMGAPPAAPWMVAKG
jgi:DNA-binding GntR family transcriptional regulator